MGPMAWAAADGPLPHDAISRLSGSANADQVAFLPFLEVVDGCQPYSAVQDDGSYSGGLKNSGSEAGACKDDRSGQAVVRTRCDAAGVCAHLYALYFPKDQGMLGSVATPGLGHRHEWENVVVWVEERVVVAVSFSQHGGYEVREPDEIVMRGTSVSAEYGTGGGLTHSFRPGRGVGSAMPSPVSWESITFAARRTLNSPEIFDAADFQARDDNFDTNLAKARPSWLRAMSGADPGADLGLTPALTSVSPRPHPGGEAEHLVGNGPRRG